MNGVLRTASEARTQDWLEGIAHNVDQTRALCGLVMGEPINDEIGADRFRLAVRIGTALDRIAEALQQAGIEHR